MFLKTALTSGLVCHHIEDIFEVIIVDIFVTDTIVVDITIVDV